MYKLNKLGTNPTDCANSITENIYKPSMTNIRTNL